MEVEEKKIIKGNKSEKMTGDNKSANVEIDKV